MRALIEEIHGGGVFDPGDVAIAIAQHVCENVEN
jgi:hypothetical protein